MDRHLVKWNSILENDVDGGLFESSLPETVNRQYRGLLLSGIFAMPTKTPVSFSFAIRMLGDYQTIAFRTRQIGHEPGQYFWYISNFIKWISDLGYHIELTGDEFQIMRPSSTLS